MKMYGFNKGTNGTTQVLVRGKPYLDYFYRTRD